MSLQKDILDYVCDLHGYLIRLKEIHWSTNNNAEHLLCDELMDDIRDSEDKFMESAMGLYDSKIKVGELKPYLPNATELKSMLNEMKIETVAIRSKLTKPEESGLVTVLDDILLFIGKYLYRATQK